MVLVVKNLPTNVGDVRDRGSIPGWGRSSGLEHGNLFQYSCLENLMDRGPWRATVQGVTKSQAQLQQLTYIHIENWGICIFSTPHFWWCLIILVLRYSDLSDFLKKWRIFWGRVPGSSGSRSFWSPLAQDSYRLRRGSGNSVHFTFFFLKESFLNLIR